MLTSWSNLLNVFFSTSRLSSFLLHLSCGVNSQNFAITSSITLFSPTQTVGLPEGENIMSKISMSQSTASSLAFLIMPFLRLEKVICLLLLCSSLLIASFILPISSTALQRLLWQAPTNPSAANADHMSNSRWRIYSTTPSTSMKKTSTRLIIFGDFPELADLCILPNTYSSPQIRHETERSKQQAKTDLTLDFPPIRCPAAPPQRQPFVLSSNSDSLLPIRKDLSKFKFFSNPEP